MQIPIEHIREIHDDPLDCDCCGEKISEDCHFVDPGYVCEKCFGAFEDNAENEAASYATENCRITEPLPKWDETKAWSISPEQFESGNRVSNTENAYRTRCRHEYTNYDQLIAPLDKSNPMDYFRYSAIRDRIDKLVDDEIDRKELIKTEKDLY